MPVSSNRLAVDLSGSLIRVLDGALGGPMRCGSGGTPLGSLVGGRVQDVDAVGSALRQLLARTEIHESRASIAASDAVATFRVLKVPQSASNHEIDSQVSKELPMDPERMTTHWVDVGGGLDHRLVYAVAWDRSLVKNLTDAAKHAGLEPIAVDLKSACIARAVAEPSCVVLDMSSDPLEIVLIDGNVPRVWHSFRLDGVTGEDAGQALVTPLRTVLRFYQRQRNANFAATAPVFVAGEQMLSAHALAGLSEVLRHPIAPLPAPARVPPEVRHGTYLACLGLIMRRTW